MIDVKAVSFSYSVRAISNCLRYIAGVRNKDEALSANGCADSKCLLHEGNSQVSIWMKGLDRRRALSHGSSPPASGNGSPETRGSAGEQSSGGRQILAVSVQGIPRERPCSLCCQGRACPHQVYSRPSEIP